MEKPKRKPEQKNSDYGFSFVTPLPVEECIHRIEHEMIYPVKLVPGRIYNYQLSGKVIPLDTETAKFSLAHNNIEIAGYLETNDAGQTFVTAKTKIHYRFIISALPFIFLASFHIVNTPGHTFFLAISIGVFSAVGCYMLFHYASEADRQTLLNSLEICLTQEKVKRKDESPEHEFDS